MSENNRYSLWLLPEKQATACFTEQIDKLGKHYRGPRFAPHITLLGWLRGTEKGLAATTEKLARQLHALNLHNAGLAGEANYFRCFYIKLEKSATVLKAHGQAATAFGTSRIPDYLPHVSLLYGNVPRPVKTAIPAEIGALPTTFKADRLQLIHVTVEVSDWRAVTTCPLASGD